MTQNEKDQLLTLLSSESRWCKNTEAQDSQGGGVCYNDSTAVAWDLTGAVCHLFGWPRALQLFAQMSRHMTGRKPLAGRYWRHPQDTQIASMAALQDYNDQPATNYESIIDRLTAMPVHHPRPSTPLTLTSNAGTCLAHAMPAGHGDENLALSPAQKGDDWSVVMTPPGSLAECFSTGAAGR